MSAITGIYTSEMDASYAADFSRDREPMKKRSRHPEYRRKGSAPTRVNGMHCRRNKRWSWGSGRGARMANLRAFAGCLAVAVAALASSAGAVTIDLVTIGDPGNAAKPSTGLGSVSGTFSMARTETTNAQYVEFLNKVDQGGTNPFGIYSASMGSSTVGGITFNAAAGSGSKYAVKVGAPAGTPAGTSYADMPVNFVSWFSAARFVNWLQGGQQTGTSTINSGAYNVGTATSGNTVARTPGATYFLPSNNEWYKAAFYTGSGYTLYPTNSNSLPANSIAAGSLANPNTANWGNTATPTTAPVNVAAYTNTKSAYGLYGMWGNVLEMTETAGASAGQYRVFGANYNTLLASPNPENWDSNSPGLSVATTTSLGGYGFRVASSEIAPVPEPETITLAAFGIVGLCGANWLKRRRKNATQPALAA